MTEYLPEGYVPPVYRSPTKWEGIAYTSLFLWLAHIILSYMVQYGFMSDLILFVLCAASTFYLVRDMLIDFSVKREVRNMTKEFESD